MLSEENYKLLTTTLLAYLKDTNVIIDCLQSVSEANKLRKDDEPITPEMEMSERVLYSLTLRLSLEKNHEDMLAFLEFMLKDLGTKEPATKELETDTTNLLGY
jgi:hypothetical protein